MLHKYDHWKHERVRCIGRGHSYVRFTPFFGFKLQLCGRVLSYSTREGFSFKKVSR